ncbi:MAG: hypothetical protein H2174_07225 [Vampirovibrio sp.]|nr:hypothetical protein [Vampirovibrio sp.]
MMSGIYRGESPPKRQGKFSQAFIGVGVYTCYRTMLGLDEVPCPLGLSWLWEALF